jgi:urease accessory protein
VDALLLLLLDSRAPTGAHSHSGGMEAAVTAGLVQDLADVEEFCRFRLRTTGLVNAAFAAHACAAWLSGAAPEVWRELDEELSARTPSAAMRIASRQLGGGLRRLLRAMLPDADLDSPWLGLPAPAPHHPLVLGAAVALAGGDPALASTAAAVATCSGPASAAVRLLGLDPFAVQAALARLLSGEGPPSGVSNAADSPRSLPSHAAPALDLLADVALTAEVRLFAS